MNTKKMIAIAALMLAAQGAVAQEVSVINNGKEFVSTKSRADVVAELAQAHADGSYDKLNAEYYDFAAGTKSTKTRAQVIAELKRAQADGSYEATQSEYYDFAADTKLTKTRAQVVAELATARADGSLAKRENLYQ